MAEEKKHIAISGVTTSSLMLGQQLLRYLPSLHIDYLDQYYCPLGVLNYGCSADTRYIAQDHFKLIQMMETERVQFFGNVPLVQSYNKEGDDPRLCFVELMDFYDSLIWFKSWADDLSSSTKDKPYRVWSGSDFMHWFNGFPQTEYEKRPPNIETLIINGINQKSLELAWMLSTPAAFLLETDIPDRSIEFLFKSGLKRIYLADQCDPRSMAVTPHFFDEYLAGSPAQNVIRQMDVDNPWIKDARFNNQATAIVNMINDYNLNSALRSRKSNSPVEVRFLFGYKMTGTREGEDNVTVNLSDISGRSKQPVEVKLAGDLLIHMPADALYQERHHREVAENKKSGHGQDDIPTVEGRMRNMRIESGHVMDTLFSVVTHDESATMSQRNYSPPMTVLDQLRRIFENLKPNAGNATEALKHHATTVNNRTLFTVANWRAVDRYERRMARKGKARQRLLSMEAITRAIREMEEEEGQ